MNPNLKTGDYIAASIPLMANLTLGDWNALLGVIGTLLGIAYLLWRWRREAQNKNDGID